METSYLRGREEAFEEVMKYLVMLNKNCDFRYIPISEFISYLESRYQAHREECSTLNRKSSQQVQSSSQEVNMHLLRANTQVSGALETLAAQAKTVSEVEGPLSQV